MTVGLSLVFAGLTISVLAAKTTDGGGIIAYAEETYGKTVSYLVG